MASTIFHHWLDQYRALPPARQRRVRAGAAILALLGVFALGIAVGRGVGFPNGLEARARRLTSQNATLADQNQALRQQQQTDTAMLGALRQTLASRDGELAKLKQDQAFYAKLIGIDSNRSGLGVHALGVTRVAGTEAWNFVATLVNTAENADVARGNLTISIDGVRAGKLATLSWTALAAPAEKEGVPFAFKFFQQVRGSILLPGDFVPNQVTVSLQANGAPAIQRKLAWRDALAGSVDAASSAP